MICVLHLEYGIRARLYKEICTCEFQFEAGVNSEGLKSAFALFR